MYPNLPPQIFQLHALQRKNIASTHQRFYRKRNNTANDYSFTTWQLQICTPFGSEGKTHIPQLLPCYHFQYLKKSLPCRAIIRRLNSLLLFTPL